MAVTQSLNLWVCFVNHCLSFCPFFMSLCCLSFELRILITPFVSSNSSCGEWICVPPTYVTSSYCCLWLKLVRTETQLFFSTQKINHISNILDMDIFSLNLPTIFVGNCQVRLVSFMSIYFSIEFGDRFLFRKKIIVSP